MQPGSELKDVLVLEDDRDTRDVLEEFLTRQRYQVASFRCAREALAALSRHRPRVLVLDLDLGVDDMNGWEFVSELKRRGVAPIPTIIISGLQKAEINASLLAAAEVLRKPVDLARLGEVLRRLVAGDAGAVGRSAR